MNSVCSVLYWQGLGNGAPAALFLSILFLFSLFCAVLRPQIGVLAAAVCLQPVQRTVFNARVCVVLPPCVL